MTPLLSISLSHGSLEGRIARVTIKNGREVIGSCYVTAGDLARALAGTLVPCALSYEDAEAILKTLPERG